MDRVKPERRAPFGDNREVGQRGAQTHTKLLDAALEIFGESGYHGARVEAIAERAGCSRPTFYQYFSDKGELFRQLAGTLADELDSLMADIGEVDSSAAGRAALGVWIDGLLDLHSRHGPVFRAFEASLRADELMTTGAHRRYQRMGKSLARALSRPLASEVQLDRYAAVVNSTATRACGLWQRMPGSLTRERFASGLADFTHRCFFGPRIGVNVHAQVGGPASGSRVGRRPPPAPEALPTHPRARRAREKLLAAATEIFGRIGFDRARIDDIVHQAGMSHGSFYRYFAGKQAIFEELSRPALEDMLLLLGGLPDPRGGFASWSRRLYQTYAIHGSLFSAWSEMGGANPSLSRGVEAEVSEVVADALAERCHGDIEVDRIVLIAHTERGPYMAHVYPDFALGDAVASTALILERAFFGPP